MQHAALLLLVLLLPLYSLLCLAGATADVNGSSGTTTSCAPATCGNLSITYPFSIVGVQARYCGFTAFELTCDGSRAYLSRTFRERLYRVLIIFYDNSSLVMAVEAAFAGDAACFIPDFNVSAGIALLPLNVSTTNRNLTFIYNCIPAVEDLKSVRPWRNEDAAERSWLGIL